MDDKSQVLTHDEEEAVVLAVIHGQGGATEADCAKAMAWAHEAKITATLFEMVRAGRIHLQIAPDGEVLFKAPAEVAS